MCLCSLSVYVHVCMRVCVLYVFACIHARTFMHEDMHDTCIHIHMTYMQPSNSRPASQAGRHEHRHTHTHSHRQTQTHTHTLTHLGNAYVHPCIHPCIHPSIRPSVSPSMHPYIHTDMRVCDVYIVILCTISIYEAWTALSAASKELEFQQDSISKRGLVR